MIGVTVDLYYVFIKAIPYVLIEAAPVASIGRKIDRKRQ